MQSRSWLSLITILSIACIAGSFTNAQQATESESRDTLNELLTKRRDVLAKRVTTLEKKFAQGRLKFDSVAHARDQLLEAELQLAETKEQRVTLYQQRIENMRALEATIKTQYEAGVSTLETLLAATAARLQAEIELAREQQ